MTTEHDKYWQKLAEARLIGQEDEQAEDELLKPYAPPAEDSGVALRVSWADLRDERFRGAITRAMARAVDRAREEGDERKIRQAMARMQVCAHPPARAVDGRNFFEVNAPYEHKVAQRTLPHIEFPRFTDEQHRRAKELIASARQSRLAARESPTFHWPNPDDPQPESTEWLLYEGEWQPSPVVDDSPPAGSINEWYCYPSDPPPSGMFEYWIDAETLEELARESERARRQREWDGLSDEQKARSIAVERANALARINNWMAY